MNNRPPFHVHRQPSAQLVPQAAGVTPLLLLLIAVGSLAGCASRNLYWGPALSTCRGPASAPNFAKGACRNGAEYDIERRKARRSLSSAALGDDTD